MIPPEMNDADREEWERSIERNARDDQERHHLEEIRRETRDHVNYLTGGYFPESLISGSNFMKEAVRWSQALTALHIAQTHPDIEELDRERQNTPTPFDIHGRWTANYARERAKAIL
jgi:hypothetical protein